MKPGADSAMYGETRRLAAIMFTDIVGFSRQMGADEARMLWLLEVYNQVVQRAVAEHHGTVIKTKGAVCQRAKELWYSLRYIVQGVSFV